MVNQEKTSGADSYLLYGVESTYGTVVAADTHLGLIQSVNIGKINRNIISNRGLKGTTTGGQEVAKYTLGTADAGFSVDFNVFDWNFMEHVLGSKTGTGTNADPFIYTRTNSTNSLTFSGNIDNDSTDRDFQALGSKFNTITIRAEVGNPVSVTTDILSGKIAKDSVLQSGVALPSNEIINFTGTELEIPDTTSIPNIIDNIEISIERNSELQFGLGSDLAQNAINKGINYRINFTVKYLDEDLIELVMGSSGALSTLSETSLTVKFDNGTNRTSDWKFAGVVFPEYDMSQSVNEILTEGLTATARSLIITEQVSA